MNHFVCFAVSALHIVCVIPISAQIPKPADAPPPRSPSDSMKQASLPLGFRLELVAAEPLVREPSGMCWDERGRLFVCELHGYNLEGQLDIDELNKTGKLDKEVRRFFANPKLIAEAKKEQYGTIKLLLDSKGDGKIDKAIVFADRLPPCYGMVPARGGLIVACGPDIVYLADRDGDNVAEVREVLFTGFSEDLLERRINNPQWGLDGWIYFGRGQAGSAITGPHLKKPVTLPNTDFRIKADGSAIEPIIGATRTMGFAFTEWGDRFTVSTGTPAYYVPPLDWNYLARNPYVPASLKDIDVNPDQRCYPTSEPHPWRKRRAEDPGFEKYYRERYGMKESAPNGYFTSLCSPLIYQDIALPGLRGQIFACEPAQNFVHRTTLERTGDLPKVARVKEEQKSEFLTFKDPWFHPIALAHAPDGSIIIADFYREIIEDYSAIPRYLQQQYGLMNGKDHGRVWRLTHEKAVKSPPADMSKLTTDELTREVCSPHQWRRETARRLLLERNAKAVAQTLARLAGESKDIAAILNALYTLQSLGSLEAAHAKAFLAHEKPEVRVHALRLAERWLDQSEEVLKQAIGLADDVDPAVRLQAALSLGESKDRRVLAAFTQLVQKHGDQRWMANALLSSLAERSGEMLVSLMAEPAKMGKAAALVEPLCSGIAARRDAKELSQAIIQIALLKDVSLQRTCLRGMRASMRSPAPVSLTDEARAALKNLVATNDAEMRKYAEALTIALKLEEPGQRTARLGLAFKQLNDVQSSLDVQLTAISQLAFEDDAEVNSKLIDAIPSSTPKVRDAILVAVMSRRDRLAALLDAIEKKKVPVSLLSAIQRSALMESKEEDIRVRATALFKGASGANAELLPRYVEALAGKRDVQRGEAVFRERCASCHQAHGVGIAVGPNLSSEFQRAEETIIKDLLLPSDVISPGFTTYSIETTSGQLVSGVLAVESASSVTLRAAEGKEQVLLRKDIETLRASPVSLMPDDLPKVLTPADAADVIAWLRRPPTKVVLLDEDPNFAAVLKDGKGVAKFIEEDKHTGKVSLKMMPLQRSAAKINGWEYKIRENPGVGEYRYMTLAWKSLEGDGVLIELAASGKWPPAKAAVRRYFSGKNTTGWGAVQVSDKPPREWTVVTVDLWKDFGDFTLTGIAPTAMGGPALFDSIELSRSSKE